MDYSVNLSERRCRITIRRALVLLVIMLCNVILHAQNPGSKYSFHSEMVKGGDGLSLLTKIWLPTGQGPWPTVVTRTPFSKSLEDDKEAQDFACHGIAYIEQHCRGKGGSEGTFQPYILLLRGFRCIPPRTSIEELLKNLDSCT